MSENSTQVDSDEEENEEYSKLLLLADKNFWTPELVEFLMRVGTRHRIRRGEGAKPMLLTYGAWAAIGEQEAIDFLRVHGSFDSRVEPRLAPPGTRARWTFEATWPDKQAKMWRQAEVEISTSGTWRLIEEFESYRATGEFSEGAQLDRRIVAQEDVDLELHNAVADMSIKAVLRALAKGADPDADVGGIGLAAKVATLDGKNHLPILRALIEGGAALEGIAIGNWSSQPPLWAAVRMERLPAVQLLLELGADPNCSYEGQSVNGFSEAGVYNVKAFRAIKRLLLETNALRERSKLMEHVPEVEAAKEVTQKGGKRGGRL
jgi:hypothetical protein